MPLLLSVVLLPLLGSALLFLQPTWEKRRIQQVSLFISLATFMLSLMLWLLFDNSCVQFQFSDVALSEKARFGDAFTSSGKSHDICTIKMSTDQIRELISENGARHLQSNFGEEISAGEQAMLNTSWGSSSQALGTYSKPSLGIVGLDGISLFFILLTTFLIPVCLLVSNVETQVKEYHIAFLILESLMLALFSVLDLFLFYIFFESVLIPIFVIIGVWGSRERKVRAAYQFFLYTLTGSLLMLFVYNAFYGGKTTASMVCVFC